MSGFQAINTGLSLCNPLMSSSAAFGSLAVCNVSGSSCGCTPTWANCSGVTHCSTSACPGTPPTSDFYCSESGWRFDGFISSNLEISSVVYLGSIASTSITFNTLNSMLYITDPKSPCPAVQNIYLRLGSSDMSFLSVQPENTAIVEPLLVSPCSSLANIPFSTSYPTSCIQTTATPTILSNGTSFALSVQFSPVSDGCNSFVIPVMAILHAFILAVAISYVFMTHCIQRR